MPSDPDAVQPHLRAISHRPKAQEVMSLRIRIRRSLEGAPVPGQPMIVGEYILNDPGDLCWSGSRLRLLLPLLLNTLIMWVHSKEPGPAVQRHNRAGGLPGLRPGLISDG